MPNIRSLDIYETLAQAAADGVSLLFSKIERHASETSETSSLLETFSKVANHIPCSTAHEAYNKAYHASLAHKRVMLCLQPNGFVSVIQAIAENAIHGINGSLLVVVLDTPDITQQYLFDARIAAKIALLPLFEPSSIQETYDIVYEAFEYAEHHNTPVVIKISNGLCQMQATLYTKPELNQDGMAHHGYTVPKRSTHTTDIQTIASVVEKYRNFTNDALQSHFNTFFDAENKTIGIIACGIAFQHLATCFTNNEFPYPVLKIADYPISRDLVALVYDECDEVLILEDGYPFVEEQVRGLMGRGTKIRGRLDGILAPFGNLSTTVVASALGL